MDDLNIALTPEEAYAVAEFIDFNIFNAIRNDPDCVEQAVEFITGTSKEKGKRKWESALMYK